MFPWTLKNSENGDFSFAVTVIFIYFIIISLYSLFRTMLSFAEFVLKTTGFAANH